MTTLQSAGAKVMARSKRTRQAWLIVALLCAINTVNYLDKAAFGLVALPVMDEFGLTPSQFGMINSGFFALFAVSSAALSWLGDRYPTRWLLAILIAVWSVLQLPMALVNSVGVLIACRLALGAAESPNMPLSQHNLQQWFPDRKRSLPTMLLYASPAAAGIVLIPWLTGLIADRGWQSLFLVLTLAGAIVCIIWVLLGRDGPLGATDTTEGSEGQQAMRLPYRKIITSGTFLGSIAGLFVAQWALALCASWLPAYLQQGLGFSVHEMGRLVAVVFAMSAAGMIGYGFLSQWLTSRGMSGRGARVLLLAALLVAGAVMMVLATTAESPLARALFFGIGIALAQGGFGIGPVTLGQIIPAGQRAAVLGMLYTGGAVGSIIAPWAVGELIQRAPTPAEGYPHGLLLTAGVFVAVAVAITALVRPERDAARLLSHAVPANPAR